MKMGHPWESENELNLYWLLSTSEGGPLPKVCFPNKFFVQWMSHRTSIPTSIGFQFPPWVL